MLLKNVSHVSLREVVYTLGAALCLALVVGCSDSAPAGSTIEAATTISVDGSAAVKSLYQKSCIACHVSGAAGAPRTGDKDEWQRRLDAKGLDGLIDAVVNGVGSMPPTGLCSQCTRDDYRALILFMAN